ncbi:MAG TPA: hypothetical protein VEQ87_07485 [Burkholderiales bacterium]|nr:hypothetical protein [Burkholderiales bacterium]
MKKKIYLSNFSGLGNRLESLVIAFLIADRWGHSIYLHWPEKDSLRIAGTGRGRIMPWERIGSLKLRDFEAPTLAALDQPRIISLRSTYGPRELQRAFVLPTAARLSVDPSIAAAIRDAFSRRAGRPAVAVHLRQGDFHVAAERYDATAARHPAPGVWWYEHVMREYARAHPSVYFVIGYSGDAETLRHLQREFDIVTLPAVFGYRSLLPGHVSEGHPVVDLFGLACCTTLLATPTSSFSHWAANALGPQTRAILPPPQTTRERPEWRVAELRGSVALDWRDAAERGIGTRAAGALPAPAPPVTDWL